jgi:hypothetical protein
MGFGELVPRRNVFLAWFLRRDPEDPSQNRTKPVS